jgi:hypothetical protein
MATAITRSYLRGLLLPDPRLTYDAYSSTLSTATQAGPVPGEAVAAQDTYATLAAVGTQSAGGSLQVQAIRAGMPGLDSAGITWRNTGDPLYRGLDVPAIVSGFGNVAYTTTAGLYRDAYVFAASTDTLLVVYENTVQGSVRCSYRTDTASTWTDVQVFSHFGVTGSVYTTGARACGLELPSGRLLVFYAVEDASASTVNVGMSYSDTDGATWTRGQTGCLEAAISTTSQSIRRMRAAYLAGQIVLMVDVVDTSTAYSQRMAQYASADLGASFQLVDQYSGADLDNHGGFPDVAAQGDVYVLTYIRRENHATYGLLNRPWSRTLANAYAKFSAAVEARMQDASNPMSWATGTTTWADADMALCAAEGGRLYAVGRDAVAGGLDALAVRSTDDVGATWYGLGSSSHPTTKAMLWRGESVAVHPRYLSAAWQRGRMIVAHQHNSVTALAESSISIMAAGGWATVNLPSLSGAPTHARQVAWERTWLPYDLPQTMDAVSWAFTSTGAPTVAFDTAGMNVTGGVGDSATWTGSPTGTLQQGVIAEGWVDVNNGQSTIRVRAGVGGPASFEASVVATPTTISLLDVTGAVTIATVNTAAAASGVWLRIAVGRVATSGTGQCVAWYALGARGDAEDRAWVQVGASTALVQGASTTHRVQFTSGVGAGVIVNSVWRWMSYVSGAYAGTAQTGIYNVPANPGDLLARDLAAEPVYVAGGVSVYGTDGPAYRSDAWTIDAAYRYPIRAIHAEEEPSPRRAWRSTTTASEQIIAWELDGTLTSPFLGPARVLYLGGINFRTAYWEGRDGASVWQSIATIDAANGQTGLGFVLDHNIVTAATPFGGGYIDRTITANELAGAYWSSSGGTRVRPIAVNTPGVWPSLTTGDGTKVRMTITPQAGDPTNGNDGAIIMPSVTVIAAESASPSTEYNAYRLRIPAQTTSEGYFAIGVCVMGYFHVFGTQYSANRSQSMSPAYELVEGRGGARRATRLGPARRAVEVSWDEGVDAKQIAGNDANYVRLHASGPGIASVADVAPSMLGVLEQLDGAVTPIVYLPRVVPMTGGTTVRTIVEPPLMLYGRIRTESLQVDTVQGDEYDTTTGEVYRLARVRIEEEL